MTTTLFSKEILSQWQELYPDKWKEIVVVLMKTYFASSQSDLKILKQAISNCDAKNCCRLAHSLKSGSAHVGAKQLETIFSSIEKFALEGRWTKITDAIVLAETYLQPTFDQMQLYINTLNLEA